MSDGIPLKTVIRKLEKLYDPPKSFLRHRTALDLTVATILSAQCTDDRVNIVTKELFKKYRKAQDYVAVNREQFEEGIRSTGFYRNKAKNIQGMCQLLLERHGGKIPKTMEELVVLPGIGRKTAAIILYAAFDILDGVAVDTHVMRLSRRLGMSKHKTPEKIEQDLMKAAPREKWGVINTLLISHGRAVCTARKRMCEKCEFRKDCPSSEILGRTDKAK